MTNESRGNLIGLASLLIITGLVGGAIIGGFAVYYLSPQTITHTESVPVPCTLTKGWQLEAYPLVSFYHNSSGLYAFTGYSLFRLNQDRITINGSSWPMNIVVNATVYTPHGAPVCQSLVPVSNPPPYTQVWLEFGNFSGILQRMVNAQP